MASLLDTLPPHLFNRICVPLDLRSLRKLACTCKHYSNVCMSEPLWKYMSLAFLEDNLSKRTFAKNNDFANKTWREIYLSLMNSSTQDIKYKTNESKIRLFIYMAKEAPVAIILRRERMGKQLWWQLIKWNTNTDTVVRGQWMKGKLKPRYCDVSPNGEMFIYYCWRPNPKDDFSEWTAISRTPYFTAVGFWPLRGWHMLGGGRFVSDKEVQRYVSRISYTPSSSACTTVPPIRVADVDVTVPASIHHTKIADDVLPPLASTTDYRGHDQRGRVIYTKGPFIYIGEEDGASGSLFLDLSSEKFSQVVPPKWAKTWNKTA